MNNNDKRDAARYRALMNNFKHDHIWYHVLTDHAKTMGDSIEEILDNIAENGYHD